MNDVLEDGCMRLVVRCLWGVLDDVYQVLCMCWGNWVDGYWLCV